MAHLIRNKAFIVKKTRSVLGQGQFSLVVLFWFLAKDSVGKSESTEIERTPYEPTIYGEGTLELDEVLKYYNSIDFRTIMSLSESVEDKLSQFKHCFSKRYLSSLFVTDNGAKKLKMNGPIFVMSLTLANFFKSSL